MCVLGEPIGATFLAIILLGENISMMQGVGGLIVLVGVMVFLILQQKTLVVGEVELNM